MITALVTAAARGPTVWGIFLAAMLVMLAAGLVVYFLPARRSDAD